MDLKPGQGFRGVTSAGTTVHGLIIGVEGNKVSYFFVGKIDDGNGIPAKAYNSPGASGAEKDNVYLYECPPPFYDLCPDGRSNVLVKANIDKIRFVKMSYFDSGKGVILDDGVSISSSLMNEVLHHREIIDNQRQYTYNNSHTDSPEPAEEENALLSAIASYDDRPVVSKPSANGSKAYQDMCRMIQTDEPSEQSNDYERDY